MAPEVVRAQKDTWPVLAAVEARAFHDELPFCALFPDERTRAQRLLAWFRCALPGAMASGFIVETTTASRGLILWSPPDRPISVRSQLQAVPGLLPQIWTLLRAVDHADLRRATSWGRRIERRRHELMGRPHWSLDILAVDPHHQRLGYGAALVRHGLRRADADRLPTYVETNQLHNVGFYRTFGFAVVEHVAADYPPMNMPTWRMVRPPHESG
jgi:ribosomal protein S18 acetylase RimI-like enzyme